MDKVVVKNDWVNSLDVLKSGEVDSTVRNYQLILENDSKLSKHIRYNSLSDRYEYVKKDGSVRMWKDNDDAVYMSYIEENYGIYNDKKYLQALSIVMHHNEFHPIKELIENKKWDGVERIDKFLSKCMGCEDNDYSREVSRMIFYGGISRLYNPGCKFDYMPIFLGEQGIGKSTIISWLALNDSFYKEVTTIEGKDGIECIEGGWICEFSELLAMKRTKDVEALKAFVTRQVDKYRKAYGRYVSEVPRTCIFIGTTNEYEFLTDKTGNRRYLPVEINLPRGDLYDRKDEIQDYIIACWREALYLMENDKIYLSISNEYMDIVESEQERRMAEDTSLSALEEYLEKKKVGDKVCAREIFANVFRKISKDMTLSDSRTIAIYMSKFKDWERNTNPAVLGEYGRQKYWMKIDVSGDNNG